MDETKSRNAVVTQKKTALKAAVEKQQKVFTAAKKAATSKQKALETITKRKKSSDEAKQEAQDGLTIATKAATEAAETLVCVTLNQTNYTAVCEKVPAPPKLADIISELEAKQTAKGSDKKKSTKKRSRSIEKKRAEVRNTDEPEDNNDRAQSSSKRAKLETGENTAPSSARAYDSDEMNS
jgi:hypothetical protein